MSTISGLNSSSNAVAAVNPRRAQMQAKMFAKIDTDGSGGVDKAELQAKLAAISKKTGTTLDSEKLFAKMDGNGDANLTPDELAKGMKAVLPPPSTMEFAQGRQGGQGGPGAPDGKGPDNLFAKVDATSDGSVDATELKAFTDKVQSDTGRDSTASFAQLDTNSDG